jgi:hypothetical protein
MRTGRCTFKDLIDSLTESEWVEIYRYGVVVLRAYLAPYVDRRRGLSCAERQIGLTLSNSKRNRFDEAEDYVVRAIEYFCNRGLTGDWGDLIKVKRIIRKKAVQLFTDDYRYAQKMIKTWVPGYEYWSNGRDEAWADGVPEAMLAEFRQFLFGRPHGLDCGALLDVCCSTPQAVSFPPHSVSFKETVIRAKLGWHEQRYRHARELLFSYGEAFMSSYRRTVARIRPPNPLADKVV